MSCLKDKKITGRIHSIESFGTVDGPGIRFVVFMQGCPLRCLYCHNPDTWNMTDGTERSVEDILAEYDKCSEFITGGITVTGGEPLMQRDFVAELFKAAKEKGIHTCIDTSGATFNSEKSGDFDALLSVTDLVMLDIKHIDEDEHEKLTGMKNSHIKEFARYVAEKGVQIWIRHVVVPGITDRKEDWYKIGLFASTLPTLNAVEVLPYHDMGKAKYEMLKMAYPLADTPPADKETAAAARKEIMRGISDGVKGLFDVAK